MEVKATLRCGKCDVPLEVNMQKVNYDIMYIITCPKCGKKYFFFNDYSKHPMSELKEKDEDGNEEVLHD